MIDIEIIDQIAEEAARIIRGRNSKIRALRTKVRERDAELLFYRIVTPVLFLTCIAAAVTLIIL